MAKNTLTDKQRAELKDTIWLNVDTSIFGYSRLIDQLLNTLTDEQLTKFTEEFAPDHNKE
jgi:hypothetical protein